MRTIKQVLILLLVALVAGNIVTAIYRGSSDKNDPPTIVCDDTTLEVSLEEDTTAALLAGVTAYDPQDGDLTDRIIVAGVSKLISNNTAKVTYLVFDSDDNMATHIRRIRYVDYHKPYFTVDARLPLIYPQGVEVTVTDRVGAVDKKDGNISDRIRVSTLEATADPEVYEITVQVTNSLGDTAWLKLPVMMLGSDNQRPDIQLKEYLLYLEIGASFNPVDYLKTAQLADGTDIDLSQVKIDGSVDTATVGEYRVTYTYEHEGSVGKAILTVVVL